MRWPTTGHRSHVFCSMSMPVHRPDRTGRCDRARETLTAVAAEPAGGSPSRLWARLGILVAELASGNWSDAVVPLEEIARSAEAEELPWLGRLARGLQASVLLATKPEAWRADSCASLVADCTPAPDH